MSDLSQVKEKIDLEKFRSYLLSVLPGNNIIIINYLISCCIRYPTRGQQTRIRGFTVHSRSIEPYFSGRPQRQGKKLKQNK